MWESLVLGGATGTFRLVQMLLENPQEKCSYFTSNFPIFVFFPFLSDWDFLQNVKIAVDFFYLEMVNHLFEAGLSCFPIGAVCLLMSCCDPYLISTTLAQCHVHLVGIEEFPACFCYSSLGFSEKWKPPLKFCWRDQSWNFQWQQRGLNSFCAMVSPELGITS